MKEITLYENPPAICDVNSLNGFTSTEIFSKGGTDEVWGNKEERCNPFSFSSLDASMNYNENTIDKAQVDTEEEDINISLSINEVEISEKKSIKKNSLHIKTDMDPHCEWIGMGIGWDGWQGKDISTIVDNAAIEFMARVDGSPIYNIPIVFILEDYGSNQCYTTANYLGIDGGEITNNWTKVIVPLSTFSYQTHNIDLTNIKQLMMQCYAKVDIYIDDMKIIPHEHNYKKISSSLTVKEMKFPINIFSEELNSSWGINNDYCGNIKLNSDLNYPSGKFIDIDIDKNKCNWKEFGISWNDWLYTDLSSSIYGVYLEFDLKLDEYQKTKISIEDYNGKKMKIDLAKYINTTKDDKWQKIRIPMKKFPIRESAIDLTRIKNIIFAFEDKTKLKIDNIKLTN